MTSFDLRSTSSLTTATASAVLGGTLFAFSTFILPAFRRLPASDAIRAMQAINVQAPRSALMVPLFASAVGSLGVGVHELVSPGERRWLRLTGAALGVLAFVCTAVGNVPLNDRLARIDATGLHAAAEWSSYLTGWGRWNALRWISAVGSSVALIASTR